MRVVLVGFGQKGRRKCDSAAYRVEIGVAGGLATLPAADRDGVAGARSPRAAVDVVVVVVEVARPEGRGNRDVREGVGAWRAPIFASLCDSAPLTVMDGEGLVAPAPVKKKDENGTFSAPSDDDMGGGLGEGERGGPCEKICNENRNSHSLI